MLLIQRNYAKHMTRLNEEDDQIRSLDKLIRIEDTPSQIQFRNTSRNRVIDIASVIGLQNFLCGPGLVRRICSLPNWRPASTFGYANALIGFGPRSNAIAVGLPDSGEIRVSVRCAGYGWCIALTSSEC